MAQRKRRVREPERSNRRAPRKDALPPNVSFLTEQAMGSLGSSFLPKSDNQARAQNLFYQAMQAQSAEEFVGLIKHVLELDPRCVDALSAVVVMEGAGLDEQISHCRQIVEIATENLGSDFFKENRGSFWGILETRPYMRVRLQLASLLARARRVEEAIGHYEEMLELNPGDNQGLRYPLMGHYLAAGRLDGARRLLKSYAGDANAIFAWGHVLERFLSDDIAGATTARKRARAQNKHTELYLTGKRRVPKELPDYYGLGDENEAILCAYELKPACTQAFRAWLKGTP